MRLTDRLQIVRTPPERYALMVSEQRHRPVKEPTTKELETYNNQLDALARLFDGAPFTWYLEGGKILPVKTGLFLRKHADIDIGFYLDQIGDFVGFMRDKGYKFFYKNYLFPAMEYTPFEILERTGIEQMIHRPVKRLYAIKVRADGSADQDGSLVSEMDLHIHEKAGSRIMASKEKFALPSDWFSETAHYQCGKYSLEAGSLKVLYFFKLGGQRPRHVFDRELIENRGLLSPDEIAEVKEVRQRETHTSL